MPDAHQFFDDVLLFLFKSGTTVVGHFGVSADHICRINGLTTRCGKSYGYSGSVTALLIDTVQSGIGYTTVGRNAEAAAATIWVVATASEATAAVTEAAATEIDTAAAVTEAVAMTIAVVIGGTYIKRRRWPTAFY